LAGEASKYFGSGPTATPNNARAANENVSTKAFAPVC